MASRPTSSKTTVEPAVAPAAKPAKAPAKPRATRSKSAASAVSNAIQLTPEERHRVVAEAAYFIAERRGFAGGSPIEDWLQAEADIDRMLAGSTTH
ncbi:MAG TPA: DUF2934 domain-containing protein [Rhodocyclaceae bacterium]|jgi:hypothetical protein|nr:DUF2934 domain-containing protein [Rhodocyclaceae bacterium]